MTDILSVNENGKQYLWKTHVIKSQKHTDFIRLGFQISGYVQIVE